MNDSLLNSLTNALANRLAVWERDGYSTIATPWRLRDGTPVTVYVQGVKSGLYDVTDAGLAANFLGDAGVDLNKRGPRDRFKEIRAAVPFPPALLPGDRFDLSCSTETADLSEAILAIGEAAHAAQLLTPLGRRGRPRTLKQRIVRAVVSADLDYEANTQMPLRHGDTSRQVNFRVFQGERQAFLQAVTNASANAGYDHARSLFSDAAVSKGDLVAVLERDTRLDAWQREGLGEVSQVVPEEELSDYLQGHLAA